MNEFDKYLRPKVHQQFDNERFAYMADIPIPRLDPNVLRPPHSIDIDSLDDEFPQFKKMDEEVKAAFQKFQNLSCQQRKHIFDWLFISSFYGVPGLKSVTDPLEKMFLKPTPTENKLENQIVLDLESKELPEQKQITEQRDLLKALEIGRKLYLAQRFHKDDDNDEEDVSFEEEDGYEVYKPENEDQLKRFVSEADEIYLDPAIFNIDRYKGKRLTLHDDNAGNDLELLTTTRTSNIESSANLL